MKTNIGSGNHSNALKTAWNDVTGDTIVSGKGSPSAYAEGWDAIFGKPKVQEAEPVLTDAQQAIINMHLSLSEPLTTCASNQDGDCYHPDCPQLKDYQIGCPLFNWDDNDD